MILLLLNSCNKDTLDKSSQNEIIEDFQFVASFYPSFSPFLNVRVDCLNSVGTMTLLPMFLEGTSPTYKLATFNIDHNDLKKFIDSIKSIKKYMYVNEDAIMVDGMSISLYFHTYKKDTVRLLFSSYPDNKDFHDLSLAILKLAEKTVKADPYSLIIIKVKDVLVHEVNFLIQCEDPYYVIFPNSLSMNHYDEYANLIKNIPEDKQVIFDFREVWYADDTILNLFKDAKFDRVDTYYLIDSSHVYNHLTNSDYNTNNRIFDFLGLKNKKTFYNYDTLFASIFRDYNNYKYYPYLFNELTRPREGEPIEIPDYKGKE